MSCAEHVWNLIHCIEYGPGLVSITI